MYFIRCFGKLIIDGNGEHFLVMELADGGNLEKYLIAKFHNKQWPDWPAQIKLARGIANGLKSLHNNLILHRDLVSFLYSVYNEFKRPINFLSCYSIQG